MKIFTVSEVLRDVKANLETMYPDVWMEGEISNFIRHSSGHAYFSMKDAGGQVSAVMFREAFSRIRFQPENGLQVIVNGRITLYPPQGRFQVVLQSMEPKGKGGLQLAFEQLKARLQKEGLFEDSRKRPIPTLPEWIGVITSPDGAALHDILTVLHRRTAGVRVLVCPARVQGEGAAPEIVRALETLNRDYPELDVILLGRGGGSLEDLWAFNEEAAARAIAASQIPVISCVGHETDFTIADFVADLRAPTPSAAAEMVSRGRQELANQLRFAWDRLRTLVSGQLEDFAARVQQASESPYLQRPTALIEEYRQVNDDLVRRMGLAWRHRLSISEKDLDLASQKLHLLSPLATLSRGFAITWKLPERHLVHRAQSLKPADHLEIQFEEGRVYAQVERTEV